MNLRCCRLVVWSVSLLLALAGGSINAQDAARTARVYVGTYTQGTKSQGIYLLELDLQKGLLTSKGLAGESVNPSFLTVHPNHRFLYAVNEVGNFGGKPAGAVSAFAIHPETGRLTFLNQVSSRGGAPCHLILDRDGKNALLANYSGGSVASLPVGVDGRLAEASSFHQHVGKSVNKQRQQAPHAHSINLDAANRFAFAADLGLDQILVYRFDSARGTLTPHDPPAAAVAPGAGPRHFAFHPNQRYAYVINEIHSTVTAFRYDGGQGVLKEIQTISTLPDGFKGNTSTAEVQVHPSGKFLYGSNRGHDSLAIFRIDPETGRLTATGHQTGIRVPRNFGIDPTGQYLLAAHQAGNKVQVFRIDSETGGLSAVGEPVEVHAPVCVKMIVLPR